MYKPKLSFGRAFLIVLALLSLTTLVTAAGEGSGTDLISSSPFTIQEDDFGDLESQLSGMSADGDWIAFDSQSTNLQAEERYECPSNGLMPPNNTPCTPDLDYDVYLYYYFRTRDPQSGLITSETPTLQRLTPVNADGCSQFPAISRVIDTELDEPEEGADGHYVVFQTEAQNFANGTPGTSRRDIVLARLVREQEPGETAEHYKQYLADKLVNNGINYEPVEISRVSLTYDGAQPNNHSGAGWKCDNNAVMLNNFPVTFKNPIHAGADVYVRRPRDAAGNPFDPGTPGMPAGMVTVHPYVVFESLATNLIAAPVSGQHIYLRDVDGYLFVNEINSPVTPSTYLLDRNESGQIANGDSTHPVVSNNGRFLAFVSKATNLVAGTDGQTAQVYLVDRDYDQNGLYDDDGDGYQAGDIKVYLVSRRDGSGAAGNDDSFYPAIFYDPVANKVSVAFHSFASNLVSSGDTNGKADVFVYEMTAGAGNDTDATLRMASVNTEGKQGNNHSLMPSFSGNGAVITFVSYAHNLVSDDTNFACTFAGDLGSNCPDIFVHDLERGNTWRVSLTRLGQQARSDSSLPTLNGSGQYVIFTSRSNLLSEGLYTGGSMQIYVRDQGLPPGSPIIIPTYGEIYTWLNVPAQMTFTVQFLASSGTQGASEKKVGDVTVETKAPASCLPPSGGCFQQIVKGPTIDCDNRTFPVMAQDQFCYITVTYTPFNRKVQTGVVHIPINDDRVELQIGLTGAVVTGYLPLLHFGW